MTTDEDLLRDRITEELGTDPESWYRPDGYQSVALAILDSIYSTGHVYQGVINLIDRYCELRRKEEANPKIDTATDLIEAFERWGGVEGFALKTKNRWRTSSSLQAPYKAYAALEAAKILAAHSIETASDVVDRLTERESREHSDIAKEWLAITGQSSGLTWNYFLMLLGIPGVKADRMVIRFVTETLDRPKDVSSKEASRLVEAVADDLKLNYIQLDHTIWRFQSKRKHLKTSPDTPAEEEPQG